ADRFAVHKCAVGDKPRLQVVMSYIIYKGRGEPAERLCFLLALVPRQPKLEVSVATYHPHNGGPYPSPEKAQFEWRTQLGDEAGDVVDELRAEITLADPKIKPGQDIQLKFTLRRGDAEIAAGHFGRKIDAVEVWDGKYSNGYRNHGFEVRTPA